MTKTTAKIFLTVFGNLLIFISGGGIIWICQTLICVRKTQALEARSLKTAGLDRESLDKDFGIL